MYKDDVHNAKELLSIAVDDKEPTIGMSAEDPVRQMVGDREKEYNKAIDTILRWKQEIEKGKVRMTSVCWREKGRPASYDVLTMTSGRCLLS